MQVTPELLGHAQAKLRRAERALDSHKAQQLYAKATADGVEAAKDRLKTLRSPMGGEAVR
jgi:hypothetical protein